MSISLTPRLQAVVDNVIPCNTAIDVGCDHAQVGIFLTQSGKVRNMTVSDVNDGPIERAKIAVAEADLSDKITCIKCDGLEGIEPRDTVIIAGMGGELIRDIIAKAPWTKDGCRLILQPMSMGDVLREYLFKNGYKIIKETIAIERERMYSIILAEGGEQGEWDAADLFLSDLSHPDATAFLKKTVNRLKKALDGLKKAEMRDDDAIKEQERLIAELETRMNKEEVK